MTTGTGIDYKTVTVGAAEYKMIPLSPDRAIDFCTDSMIALAPVLTAVELPEAEASNYAMAFAMRVIPNIGLVNPEKLKAIFAVVREQMVLPNEKLASDVNSFHDWFTKHPSHLLESHMKGLFVLVKDFFPQGLGTLIDGLTLKNG